jgi:hypothetical protein
MERTLRDIRRVAEAAVFSTGLSVADFVRECKFCAGAADVLAESRGYLISLFVVL